MNKDIPGFYRIEITGKFIIQFLTLGYEINSDIKNIKVIKGLPKGCRLKEVKTNPILGTDEVVLEIIVSTGAKNDRVEDLNIVFQKEIK